MNKRFQKSVHKTLVGALDQLERGHRWIKGSYSREIGGVPCYCALGAIYKVGKGIAVRNAAIDVVSKHVPKPFDSDIVRFNDSSNTTYRQVAAMFRKAIKSLEA
jgi:hypothetical protein